MRSISLNFQIRQPLQLHLCRFFDIGRGIHYQDDFQNKYLTERFSEKYYIPANNLVSNMLKAYGDLFKCSFSISGTTLDMMEKYQPDALNSFVELSKNKGVEFLAMPYYNSLAFMKNEHEFKQQVELHQKRIEKLFNQTPKVFSNSNLIYSDAIGKMVGEMGYQGILSEGAKHILGWKSPNFVYHNAFDPNLKLLLRNFQFSDDISFLFADKSWSSYPLTCEKLADWLNKLPADIHCVNICIDYNLLGEMQEAQTGIFDFFYHLPRILKEQSDFSFKTPTEICKSNESVAPVYAPHAISWEGKEKDLSAWLGNDLQLDAFSKLYDLGKKVFEIDDILLLSQWRNLQNADNFYAMSTKGGYRQDMHNRFNSPYDAFINYMNILSDFALKLDNTITLKTVVSKKQTEQKAVADPRKRNTTLKTDNAMQDVDQQQPDCLLN